MSTPQTLVQAAPPHHYNLDYRQRPVLNVNDRQLPPPRPSSNASSGYYHPPPPASSSSSSAANFPPRPASTLSNRQYTHSQQPVQQQQQQHLQQFSHSRDSAAYGYPASSSGPHQLQHHGSYEDLRRTASRASQHAKPVSMSSTNAAATSAPSGQHSPYSTAHSQRHHNPQQQHHDSQQPSNVPSSSSSRHTQAGAEQDRKRKNKSPVDWVAFFNGKVPDEIITIHDDDSPAPTSAETHRVPPPTTTSSSTAATQHVDKRRRTNAAAIDASSSTAAFAEIARSSGSYSNANTTSADSLNNTTAPTSLASVGSTSSRLDGPQTGQKRKRSYVRTETDFRQDLSSARPRAYLSCYGNYMPATFQPRKQKDLHVRNVTERHKLTEKVDDDDGHYIVHEGSTIGERYKLQNLLGQGTFGKVVRASDLRTRKEVAVKIIRAVPKYRDASRIELRVLQTLRVADEHNRNRCIQLYDCFDWRGHICIVTPLLGHSVFDFLKQGGFVPFPGSHIQAFAWQLLGSIAFLHDTNLVHTDLKPENILLLNHLYQTFTYNRNIPSSSTLTSRTAKFRRVLLNPGINLIDFGSATFDDEYHSSVVSTRHYRAPEIILGIGWSFPIDLWSLGCILVECWTGDALFQTHDCAEHLAMMEMVTGAPIDRTLIREVSRTSKRSDRNSAAKFFKNGHLAYPMADTPRQSRKFVKAMKRLDEMIPPTNQFNKLFLDLLRKIFVYDPKKRITAREALKHPWFDEIVEDDGTEATKIREERERQQRENDGGVDAKRQR